VSENLWKLIGVAVMAAIVVIGVVVTSGDDTDFTRNRAFRDNPATFAGADRVQEADCCDQNAYEIEVLKKNYVLLQNQFAMLKQEFDDLSDGSVQFKLGAYPPPPPSVMETVLAMEQDCPIGDARECYVKFLVGYELEFARQVVLAQGRYGFFHRYVENAYGDGYQLSGEACGPVFYGYGDPPRFALAFDTTPNGLIAGNSVNDSSQNQYQWSRQDPLKDSPPDVNWENYVAAYDLCS